MNGIDFEILKLWRNIPRLSFIEFDENYYTFTYPKYNHKKYALLDCLDNSILKSQTTNQSFILQDFEIILNKKFKIGNI